MLLLESNTWQNISEQKKYLNNNYLIRNNSVGSLLVGLCPFGPKFIVKTYCLLCLISIRILISIYSIELLINLFAVTDLVGKYKWALGVVSRICGILLISCSIGVMPEECHLQLIHIWWIILAAKPGNLLRILGARSKYVHHYLFLQQSYPSVWTSALWVQIFYQVE